jgi:hypothetical protein
MSEESLRFIKNFEDLLNENKVQENKVNSLKTVKASLEEEINQLRLKVEEIQKDINQRLIDCNREIFERKSHAETNMEKEAFRLANLSEDLNIRKIQLSDIETKQRQRESLLNERERKLNDREAAVIARDVRINDKMSINEGHDRAIASSQMDIKKAWQKIDEELSGIKAAKGGILLVQAEINKQQEELRAREEEVSFYEKHVDEHRRLNESESKRISFEWERIAVANKELNIQKATEDKHEKDNYDKEQSLKALQTEMSFQMAKFKQEHGIK